MGKCPFVIKCKILNFILFLQTFLLHERLSNLESFEYKTNFNFWNIFQSHDIKRAKWDNIGFFYRGDNYFSGNTDWLLSAGMLGDARGNQIGVQGRWLKAV